MTNKVAIVTDSLACLTGELLGEYRIGVVPLNIHFEGKVYKDWVDITPSQSYELFLKNPGSWGSSAPSPTDFLNAYREASQQAKSILYVAISAKLSATYDAAQIAKEQAEAELPGTAVEVLDSQTTTAAEGFVALAAARAAAEGRNLVEVINAAEEMRDKVKFFAFLDTVRHIYRSGRIPKIASQAGSVLHIKPILTVSSGLVHFAGVARSKKSGVERLLKIMRDKVGLRPVHVAVMHAYALDEGEKLKERVSAEFNCAELWLTEFSPVMGYACGTGTLGIAFYPEN